MNELMQLINKFDDSPELGQKKPLGKVLVIDDDPNIRQGLERTLKQRNFDVVSTPNGLDSVSLLCDDIGCVLLDVKMPKISGIEVYGMLKEKDPGVPIIFYSAYPGGEEMAQKCLDLKPYGFIEKGVSEQIDRLYALIAGAAAEFRIRA
ncbi:MAG: response regulator [Desulfobacteraceae bacterium]|nr:response regulator [Desulfobacteraceae bacterium]